MDVALRDLAADEVECVKWALYEAVSWAPDRELPPYEALVDHPELLRYHRDWGRSGDAAIVAIDGDGVVGVAFYRLFTDDDHGHGYVDAETPELGIAVAAGYRGRGVGTRLMRGLEQVARGAGMRRLSLSVDPENPALRLYERLGYRELSRDDARGVRMLLELERASR